MVHEHVLTTPDGRTLRTFVAGDSGPAVFGLSGTPGAGPPYPPHAEDACGRGARLVSFDRPGYGGSARRPGRSVSDVTDDVVAVADALDLDRFVVWGISGGAPHALACAALLPDRVAAAAALAAPAPFDADGLDWWAGMGEDNLDEFGAALAGEPELEAYLEGQAEQLRALGPEQVADALRSLLTPLDAAAVTGDFAEYLHRSFAAAVQSGVYGWLDDDLAFVHPWGFDFAEIRVPVLLWHGEHDLFVPIAHGRWLAERIPGVDARLSAEDGHLTLATRRVGDVHEWLLERV